MERAMSQSRSARCYEELLDTIGEAVIATDPAGRVNYWNRAAERLYGWPRAEALGRDVVEVIASAPARAQAEATQALWQRDQEREELIRQLEVERARLDSLLMIAPAFLATVRGPEHLIEMANGRYFQLAGQRDLIGKPVREAFPDIVGQGFLELLDRVYATGEPFTGEEMKVVLRRTPGGAPEERFINFVFQLIRDGNGAGSGIFIHGVDVTGQVRARRKAQRVAAEHAAILRHIQDGVIVLDAAGRLSFANQAAARLHGLEGFGVDLEGDIAAHGLVFRGADGEIIPSTRLPVQRALRDQETIAATVVHIAGRGSDAVIVEASASPIRAEDGTSRGAVAVLRDITERRQAQERLAAAEAHYRRLVEDSPVGIFAVDAQGRFREVNPVAASVVGRSASECLSLGIAEVVAEEDQEALCDAEARMRSGEELVEVEVHLLRPPGERRLVHIRSIPDRDADRRVVGYQGVLRDITEERARDEEIRLLGTALDRLENAVGVLDSSNRLVYANAAHGRLFGYDPSPGERHGASGFLTLETLRATPGIFETLRNSGGWSGRVTCHRMDGSELPLQVIVGRLEKEGRELFLTIARDVSAEAEWEKQLRRAERLASVGTLLSGIAHELNNPLHAITNFAHLLLMEPRSEGDREALEIMQLEADRAAKVVADLRVIARQSRGEESEHGLFDLNEAACNVSRLRSYTHETHNIRLELRLAPGLPRIPGNRGQIEQCLLNLVVNAEQAIEGRKRKRIVVATEVHQDVVSLRVGDNGPGVSPEHLDRIFDPFWTTKGPGGGAGLGLSLVHSIVEEHAGRVSVQSEPGKGASFAIELPLTSRRERTVEVARNGLGPSRRLRVLVVDDEESVRRSLDRFLSLRGHQVDVACDGRAALALIENENPGSAYDVILSDLRMPGLSGDELLERIRARGDQMGQRVVFMTGDTASMGGGGILDAPDIPLLVKPVAPEHLAAAIEGQADRAFFAEPS